MIRAKWNENKKCTDCKVTGNIKSIINEFETIIAALLKVNIVDVDKVLKILSICIKDNKLEDQLIDSNKETINDLIK